MILTIVFNTYRILSCFELVFVFSILNLSAQVLPEILQNKAITDELEYLIFTGGGAGYWKPSHTVYNTFWNIDDIHVNRVDRVNLPEMILNGMVDGLFARIIGVHGNTDFKVDYEPNAYLVRIYTRVEAAPSLYLSIK